ncbi:MAG: hypothetical protein M1824_003298 [Vezdaea acicularis]|nr:MAG: hypothetical protein M1824_003298 [Vezdaea acicularis]
MPNSLSRLRFIALNVIWLPSVFAQVGSYDRPPGWIESVPVPTPPEGIDPRLLIHCEGGPPPFALPPPYQISDIIGDGYSSIQEVCALEEFGGRHNANTAGYCAYFMPENSFGSRVAFDPERAAPGMFDIIPSRGQLQLYCATKCSCRPDLYPSQPNQRPFPIGFTIRAEPQYNVVDFVAQWRSRPMDQDEFYYCRRNPQQVLVPNVVFPISSLRGRERIVMASKRITGTEEITIRCRGRAPLFPIPGPWTNDVFRTSQRLCAATVNGGRGAGNAGGMCWPFESNPLDVGEPFVNFLEEFSHPALTYEVGQGLNGQMILATRLFCFARCWCTKFARRPRQKVPWLRDAEVELRDDSVLFTVQTADNQWTTVTLSDPPHPPNAVVFFGSQGSCRDSGTREPGCAPTAIVALPMIPKKDELDTLLGPPNNGILYPGFPDQGGTRKWIGQYSCFAGPCLGNEECGTWAEGYRCTRSQSGGLSVDGFDGGRRKAGLCLLNWNANIAVKLGVRTIGNGVECFCNATFVDERCCTNQVVSL